MTEELTDKYEVTKGWGHCEGCSETKTGLKTFLFNGSHYSFCRSCRFDLVELLLEITIPKKVGVYRKQRLDEHLKKWLK